MLDRIDPEFVPSPTTIAWMQYIRKKPMLIASIRHPGLFGIHNFTVDWILFLLSVMLELVGLAAIVALFNTGESGIEGLVAAAAGAFAVDLACAWGHHYFATGINTKLEIENILSSNNPSLTDRTTMTKNNETIASRKRISLLFLGALILLAALKFTAYFMLSDNTGSSGMLLWMGVVYLGAAIIHITRTGYWIAGFIAWFLHRKDEKSFVKSDGRQCKAVIRDVPLANIPGYSSLLSVGEHAIVHETTAGEAKKQYILRINGLLMDKEIEDFTGKITDPKAKTDFILRAMDAQRRMLPA